MAKATSKKTKSAGLEPKPTEESGTPTIFAYLVFPVSIFIIIALIVYIRRDSNAASESETLTQ